jgi:hypothetical protein
VVGYTLSTDFVPGVPVLCAQVSLANSGLKIGNQVKMIIVFNKVCNVPW